MSSLSDKVAIVTGASRGIGSVIARELARAGAKVVVNYAGNREAAATVVAAIAAGGGSALAVQADVSRAADVKRLFDEAVTRFGKVDILVNNAGVVVYKLLKDYSEDDFDRLFAINVRGTFLMLREAAARLEAGGRVINFSSSVTRFILPTYSGYAATKAAVDQLTRVFAKEVGARGITVNAVAPGPTNTELFTDGKSPEVIQRLAALSAFNRIGDPVEIARVVLFLAGPDAGWITGQTIGANGGMA